MTPTENLIREHRDIVELLRVMNKIAVNIESKNVFYTSDVEDIIEFLNFFIDKSHHGKEELFYNELALSDMSKDNEPISVMLYEHVLTRQYIRDIRSCIENCKVGNNFSQDLLAESLVNYARLINNHITKEENIIFPMANKALSEEKQEELYHKFIQVEERVEEHGFQEHYRNLLKKLQVNYPD